MARETFDNWIPVEYSADVIQRPAIQSFVLSSVTQTPMKYESMVVPRSGAAHVATTAKGSAFSEDSGTNDKVTLSAVKFGLVFRIANEDISDSIVDLIKIKQAEFGRSYAITLDNAALGTTAVANLGTVPFNSLYYSLRHDDTGSGYTADTNRVATAGTGAAVTYDNLSALLATVEGSQWYAPDRALIVAHPSFKSQIRGIKTSQNLPVFINSDFGGVAGGAPDTLFGIPIKWSLGARTNATASDAPTGNPLMFITNPDYLMAGDRGGVKAKVDTSVGTLTDETILAMQARNAFAVSVPAAHGVLELLP